MADCLDFALLEVDGDNYLYTSMTFGLQNSDMLIIITLFIIGWDISIKETFFHEHFDYHKIQFTWEEGNKC